MGIGDWRLGIAQSPIPSPKTPIPKIKITRNLIKIN